MFRLLFLTIVFCLRAAVAVPCRVHWLQFEESCYGFGEILVTWTDADDLCRSAGARLVEIETAAENDFLKTQARQKDGNYWAGANDVFHEGTWTWMSTGALVHPFSDWMGANPDDFNGAQDCLYLGVNYDYKWDDSSCDVKFYFICEAGLDETVVG